MFDVLIDSAQKRWPPNRVAIALAALLTPFIALAAAAATAWLQTHFPGLPEFTTAQVTATVVAVVIAVVTTIVTLVYQLVDGWQKEQAQAAHVLTAHINATGQVPVAAERLLEAGPFSIGAPQPEPGPVTHAPPQA